jgi:elongation factor P
MVQTRMVNIETGSNAEHRFRSEDKVDRANMEQHSLQFSYRAGDDFHFMNTENYEMIPLPADVLGEAVGYLTEGMVMQADYFQGRVVGVEVPMFVELAVTDTTPTIKGATAAASPKPATLETGLEIKVPQYVNVGPIQQNHPARHKACGVKFKWERHSRSRGPHPRVLEHRLPIA